jgi:hypothetical protein
MSFRESACTCLTSTVTLPSFRLTIQVWCAFTLSGTVIVSQLPFETSGISNPAIHCNDSEGLHILLSHCLSLQSVHITLHSLPPGSISISHCIAYLQEVFPYHTASLTSRKYFHITLHSLPPGSISISHCIAYLPEVFPPCVTLNV